MSVLSFDGGAERMGWSILDRNGSKPVYIDSGLVELPRNNIAFQEYRLQLINTLVYLLNRPMSVLETEWQPVSEVVTETVPALGSFGGVQMYLVNVAVTTVQAMAFDRGIPVSQIGATTVHTAMAGKKKKNKKTTKVQVRNGVLKLLPELEYRKPDWTKKFDEPDAIAIGLTSLGFYNKDVL